MNSRTPGPPSGESPTAYSYIRFSDASQSRGDSLRRQLERSRQYAADHGLRLDESTTIQDLGVSAYRGANRQSGALGAFQAAVTTGKIARGSYLLVESLDRLSRQKPTAALGPFMELINADITIVTLIDGVVHSKTKYEDDWTGLIISLAKMAQAHEESAKKSDRLSQVWRTKQAKASDGIITTARCPGWLRKEGNSFSLIPDRVAVVRRIFEEFVGGLGRGMIALRLNRDQIPPFGHGTGWHGGSVQKVTINAAVIGQYVPHTVSREHVTGPDGKPMVREKRTPIGEPIQGYYPAIIPPELYYRAQGIAADRSVKPGNTGGRKGTVVSNLFAGLTTCIMCQRPMVYKDRGPRSTIILRCSGDRIGVCENANRYPYKALELAVLRWVEELDLSETQMDQIAEIKGKISSITAERARLLNTVRLFIDEFDGKSRLIRERILEIEKRIDDVDTEISTHRRKLEQAMGAVPPSERKAHFSSLRLRMSDAEGVELYKVRAALAQSLRDIVKIMLFNRSGNVRLVLKGAEKHYIFNPVRDQFSERFAVEAIRFKLIPDDEATGEQRALLDTIASLQAAIASSDA